VAGGAPHKTLDVAFRMTLESEAPAESVRETLVTESA